MHSHNIVPILCTKYLNVCERHTALKDLLVWKHLVKFMNIMSFALVNPHLYSEVNGSSWNCDSDTKTTAHDLKRSMHSFGVIVGLTILKNSLDYLKVLSAKLQRRDIYVFDAYRMIDNMKSEIQCLKDNLM